MSVKFIELFSGVGGFRYGLEAVGNQHTTKESKQTKPEVFFGGKWVSIKQRNILHPEHTGGVREFDCVYSNEWDKYAASIYRRHYGEIDQRDITTVHVSEIPEHDLLTGGFPCQAFSVAGKRLGFEDTRGTLFFEIARILKHHRPGHLLLENVKGLLSHESGETFHTIIRVLTDLGYRVEWMVLNSKHFGVPQNRERVFIIGHLRGECGGKVFPIIGSSGETNLESTAIDKNYWKGPDNHAQRTMIEITSGQSQGYRVYDPEGVSSTLAGEAGGLGAKTGLYAVTRGRSDDEYTLGNTAPTVRNGDKADIRIIDSPRIRRLTPVECERLQGFPDNWTELGVNLEGEVEDISDTQRYKTLWNAVTTNVITALGQALMEHVYQTGGRGGQK